MSELIVSGELDLSDLGTLEDEAVIEKLMQIKGIGRWSAEMFLMFTLARPDVFSTGDLGLVRAVELAYKRPDITVDELTKLALAWSPYRTFAAQVLWHSRDNTPKI
jgi:DNA-3-methyladenine glycosylase II